MTRASLCACLPAALGAFDFGLLALAGPRIAPALGVSGDAYPWLFSTSSFAYGAAVVPAAARTRRLGPQRALALGLAGAAAALLGLAGSRGIVATLLARAVFGLSGAICAGAALAVLAAVADRAGRAAGFAALGGAVAAGFATGTLVASAEPWRLVLVIASGVVVACSAVAARLPSTHSPQGPIEGAGLLTAAVVLVAAALAAAGAGSWLALPLAVSAGLALRRVLPRLPGSANLPRACVAGAATTATGVGATILIGPALAAEHLPPSLLAVFGLGVVPGAWAARRLIAVAAPSIAASAGVLFQALALVAVALALDAPAFAVSAALLAFGAGHVVANAAAAATALASGPAASSAALLVASQYAGGGVGPLAATAVADAHGSTAAILIAAAIAAVAAVGCLGRRAGTTAAHGNQSASRPRAPTRVRR